MASTQEHLPIADIKDDVILLKDGSLAVVLQTSAVNFGLLSENEQLAIISSFAGLLNSLSFMIQIIIRSKKLDISSYLNSLDEAQRKQRNPLLSSMIIRYKSFIQNTVAENEVLDKNFYICISVSGLELGLGKSAQNAFKKATTILYPRRDNVIRQLSRIGLKATQLKTPDLIKLFYDIYNEDITTKPLPVIAENKPIPAPTLLTPSKFVSPQVSVQSTQSIRTPIPTVNQPVQPSPQPVVQPRPTQPTPIQTNRRSPYIVEELPEDYGSV